MSKLVNFTLWHCKDARSLRCLQTILELNIKGFKLITMPFPPRVLYKEFLNHNILGTIPYFEDGETKMTESVAICEYLVQKYGPSDLKVDPTEKDFGAYLNWMHHSEATLTFPQTVVLRYTLQEPGVADEAAKGYARWYLARLKLLNETLNDGREFLCSNRFTLADISITFALYLGQRLQYEDKYISDYYKPQTKLYLSRMMQRQSWIDSQLIQKQSEEQFMKTKL